ncbi:MAG: hypothetical protein EZS28_024658 [Streblomastix strix]|uniref:NrS-1 polymerase-like helicase domain-containing protein n=1 Tax=Streblomastix strix TaxID=222440 RepID=A0A5J4VB82_9EUKA|nr:MAG: hypothetical protein EZS28_024658 [Streblomastix strix]
MSDGKKNGIKENRVMLPDSIIHDDDYDKTQIEYSYPTAPDGFWERSNLSSLWDILNAWNVDPRQDDYVKEKRIIYADGTSIPMNEELNNTIAERFNGIQIHNYATKSSDEVTLLPLFQSLNALNQYISADKIGELYDKIHSIANLTAKATQHWSDVKLKVGDDVGYNKPSLLVTYIKNFIQKYYDEILKKCISDHMKQFNEQKRQKQKIELIDKVNKQMIDLKDPFLLMPHLQEKAIKGEYKDESELMQDLMRVMCYTSAKDGSAMYMVKQWDLATEINTVSYMSEQNVRSLMNKVIWKKNKKTYDIFHEFNHLFHKIGIKFYSKNPNEFSIFQGLKYNVLEQVDISIIEQFLELVKDTIAAGDEIVYEYILNWLAWIVQNIGEKSGVSPVLIGTQGIGKTMFTNAICELFAGYSVPNISSMEQLTGQYNQLIEDKIFAVPNELRNVGDGSNKQSNSDKLKTLITEKYIAIRQKYIPEHMTQNPTNFIFTSNNSRPVWIEARDRRFLVCQCNAPHVGDSDYFDRLGDSYKIKEFYENLLTNLTFRDIKQFKIHKIPMIEAKKNIMKVSRNAIDEFIIKRYDQLVAGVECSIVKGWRPSTYQEKYFITDIGRYCDRKQKRISGKPTGICILKEDAKKLYKQKSEYQKQESDQIDEQDNEYVDVVFGEQHTETNNETINE